MYYRRPKRQPRRHRPRPEDRPEDVVPFVEAATVELCRITLFNPQTGRDCVISAVSGKRPGNLHVTLNGEHTPKLDTTTKLADWLRRKLPRTSAKRATGE